MGDLLFFHVSMGSGRPSICPILAISQERLKVVSSKSVHIDSGRKTDYNLVAKGQRSRSV